MSKETRHLIERLTKKLRLVQDPTLCFMRTAAKFTGLQTKVLQSLISKKEPTEMKIEPIDRSLIYHKYIFFCLNLKKLPSTWELFDVLFSEIPMYIDIGTFRKILIKMDFMWKKTRMSIVVVERPCVRLERYNYLKKIMLHQEINADNLYYIDEFGIDMKGNLMDCKLTKVHELKENVRGKVLRVIYALGPEGVVCLERIEDFNEQCVKQWVNDHLLPTLPNPSVFVFKTLPHYSQKNLETPTLDSLKRNIMRWLDHHGVTYDEEMSKYELFALAEKLTDLNVELFTINQMAEELGHSVLRIPKCIENLTPTALLFKAVDDVLPELVAEDKPEMKLDDLLMMLREVVNTATSVHLAEFNRYIMDLVKNYVQKEDEMDEVLDSLLIKADTVKCIVDSDLPSFSDSD